MMLTFSSKHHCAISKASRSAATAAVHLYCFYIWPGSLNTAFHDRCFNAKTPFHIISKSHTFHCYGFIFFSFQDQSFCSHPTQKNGHQRSLSSHHRVRFLPPQQQVRSLWCFIPFKHQVKNWKQPIGSCWLYMMCYLLFLFLFLIECICREKKSLNFN